MGVTGQVPNLILVAFSPEGVMVLRADANLPAMGGVAYFVPVASCGCAPDLGTTDYLRECDECGNVWRSAMCRHGQPACPRCAAITE